MVYEGVALCRTSLMNNLDVNVSQLKLLVSKEEIKEKVEELGGKITETYAPKGCVIICVLKGSFVFTADLVRCLQVPVMIDFIRVQSYGNQMASSGEVALIKDIEMNISCKDVLIVDDIIETGYTQAFMLKHLAQFNPTSIKICTLLWKKGLLKTDIPIHFYGFEVSPSFVVGYGIDYAERFRELPGIYAVEV